MQFLKLTGNLERAIHEAGENAKMSGTRELLLLDGYIKVGHIFSAFSSQLLRNKMAHADYGNAFLSGQQKQRNAPAGHVVKETWMLLWTMHCGILQMEFISRRTSTLIWQWQ